ncbi:hypothetical protein MYCTH_2106779 [Thermothelomyces thermophilus ATCC 42464]|uniref:Uncharacterized protein n=1 Tax=Thermothelomyces thermophilus (strain ATCC 42464 / BCRC 31852 / DSM 1799) TaxID=573729 RepID=G2PZY0_THET4|nr:uncharacterized protein MYCTH_2106779 [Thermothelomyces thermophilus ATCC 42464]AEO54003.1 hypothetical protein MYCTH_2106779 [Thermothelomyces thermophilus ATCC 42464]
MISESPPALPVSIAGLVKHIAQHPDTSMMELLEPYRKFEAHLRQLFAQDPDNKLVKDPYIQVYHASSPYDSAPEEFQRNSNIFSESPLSELDWSNVVAAGSSVVNTPLSIPEEYSRTKRGLREFDHEKFCPASDVDLFGLTEEQAIEKIKAIEAAVRRCCPYRDYRREDQAGHHHQDPDRVDIDFSAAAYDGKQVYCTPRALQSYMTQIDHINLSRRSPSYENRLSKYSHRGFEVYFPELDRSRIDATVFERSFRGTVGLARLLVPEQLPTQEVRDAYQSGRRLERDRPPLNHHRRQIPALRGDIKRGHEDEVADWFTEEDISDYRTFTMPYGPRFNAKRIETLCYTRDLLLNAEWNQHNGREVYLHRHPAFFVRVEDVIDDCCGHCPVPKTAEEKEVAQQDEKVFVSDKITFMKDDPGRDRLPREQQIVGPRDLEIVKILLHKSAANEAEYEEKKLQRRRQEDPKDTDRGETEGKVTEGGDESDGEPVDGSDSEAGGKSMATGSFVKVKREEAAPLDDAAGDDNKDEPDFYDINVTAWDTPCSALHLAVVNGHMHVVRALVQEYGADVLLPVKFDEKDALLTLVLALALPVEKAKEMTRLWSASGPLQLKRPTAINHLGFSNGWSCDSPLQAAVRNGNLGLVVKLLDQGAAPQIDFEKWLKSAKQSSTMTNQLRTLPDKEMTFKRMVEQPLMLALKSSRPDMAIELLERGADPNVILKDMQYYLSKGFGGPGVDGRCPLDLVDHCLQTLRKYQKESARVSTRPTLPEGIDAYLNQFEEGTYQHWVVSGDIERRRKFHEQNLKEYEKEQSLPDVPSELREKRLPLRKRSRSWKRSRKRSSVAQALDAEDEVSGFYSFPIDDFKVAIEGGYVKLFGEIIRRTGAGLPLESMGSTVYGKKRKDWAEAGRGGISSSAGTQTSPLLIAVFAGQIETVEWFLSDTPQRHYLAFANSKGARDDARLKHLAQAPGGFEGAISRWLSDQILHAAIYALPSKRASWLLTWAANGVAPLLLASRLGWLDAARILIEAGADQRTKDHGRNNLLHGADPAIIRAVVDFDPSLLWIEHAVGRTPAEVAHDCYLADFVKKSKNWTCEGPGKPVTWLATASPFELIKPKVCDEPREHETATNVAKNWRFCAEVLARNGQPRRTLVGLGSANLVAKRLGRRHVHDRYNFRFVEKEQDEAVASEPAESKDDASDGSDRGAAPSTEEATRPAGLATEEKTGRRRRRRTDEITQRYDSRHHAWLRPEGEKEEKEKGNDDGRESDSSACDKTADDEQEG